MRRAHVGPVLSLALLLAWGAARGQELPSPRVVPFAPAGPPAAMYPAPYPMPYPPPAAYRTSAYEVWQYYGVNRSGQWRPLVIDHPNAGPRFQWQGVPYPWMYNHQLEYVPWARD
jgi:hypothetical protein